MRRLHFPPGRDWQENRSTNTVVCEVKSSMTLQRLAYFVLLAKASPRDAARAFLEEAPEGVVMQLTGVLEWRDEDVAAFEAQSVAIPVSGRWGMFWLASPRFDKALVPPAPRLAPSGIKALACGVADELLAASEPLCGAA